MMPGKAAWALTAAAVCAAAAAAVAVRYRRGGQMPRRPRRPDEEYQRIVEAITRGVLHAQRGENDGGGTPQRLYRVG